MNKLFVLSFYFFLIAAAVNGNILMDLNEEMSPIFREDHGKYNEFGTNQLNSSQIDRFSEPIANEVHNLMNPQWRQKVRQRKEYNYLASKVVKDFRDSYKRKAFASKIMDKLKQMEWRKDRNVAKIQVVDNFKSKMKDWKAIISHW